MFIYEPRQPENPTFAPNFASIEAADNAAAGLWDATRDLQVLRDNANNEWAARSEAYDRRNRAIFDATGVQLDNPMIYDVLALKPEPGAAGLPEPSARDDIARQEANWLAQVRRLARERPEHAGVIAAGRAIQQDAYDITRAAEARFNAANAAAADLSATRRTINMLAGGVSGMLRDPLQVTALVAGGSSSGARTAFGRILSTMFTEAAVNAGVEGAVQFAAQDYKRRAGVEHGLGDALTQVGIAGLFGGGFGGLAAGGAEVFRLTGKAVAPEVLARATQGNPEPGDARIIADALGLQLDPQAEKVADLAAEQRSLDAAAFGQPPAEISDAASAALAASAVRTIENPADSVPRIDLQERIEAIDDGGELAAMGLSRTFVPGGGALVRKDGRKLDMAREAAAEAGYFDHIYGDPERATAESTVADLLRMLRQEAGGDPAFSARNDGGRQFEWLAFEQRQKAQDAYRELVGRIDSAAEEFGFERIDDAIMVRAAELVDDETDELAALERALEEDYRAYDAALAERGEGFSDEPEFDIPFFGEDRGFEGSPEPRAGSASGRNADQARGERGSAGRSTDAPDVQQLPPSRGDEGTAQPLRAAGETPEPGSAEAGETAAATLLEVRGDADFLPIDVWDAMPAGRSADGEVSHVTHAQLVEDAERDEFFGDLIASCKD